MPKDWYIKFEVSKWVSDTRHLSRTARCLWLDLLCLMHDSPRRGYLLVSAGIPLTLEQIARFTGAPTEEVSRELRELVDSGVASITSDGIYYSRRMVRESEISHVRSEAGKNRQQTCQQNVSKQASKTSANQSANMHQNPNSNYNYDYEGLGVQGEGGSTDPDDDLDSRIRRHVGGMVSVLWSPRVHAKFRKIVDGYGWDAAVGALDKAIAEGASEPFSYAGAILDRGKVRKRAKADDSEEVLKQAMEMLNAKR